LTEQKRFFFKTDRHGVRIGHETAWGL
jgi:hypothetical protein